MIVRLKCQRAFTLVELMIVIAIISILASMAVPEYYNFRCKAKQSEARESLGMIAKCQEAYFFEYDTFSTDKNRIGFYMMGTPYYTYQIVSADIDGFVAKASAEYKGKPDDWSINETFVLTNHQNACTW
jgi:prepilin-type N-terminal cleavage/methylation domain-containing protein